MRTRLAALAIATTIAALLLGGCGDDDGGGSDSSSSGGGSDAPVDLSGEVNDEGTEDATGTDSLELAADDFFFAPTFVQATPGSTLTFTVSNEGDASHTFTVDDQDIDTEVTSGESADVQVTVPDDGTVNFYCRFHLSQGMQGAVFTGSGAGSGAGGGSDPQPADTGSTGGTPGY
jgi:plastocyanin